MIRLERYATQVARWPAVGRQILASYDDTSVIVYQAYRPSLATWAIVNGRLGGPDFSFTRMSWIKPNFLWMMYRSAWGTKPDQEGVIGLRIRRAFFDLLLQRAVSSSFEPARHASREAWQEALRTSTVRLQWDPDHDPSGAPVERRAIQLGLRGPDLQQLSGPALLEVIDMSSVVAAGRHRLAAAELHLLDTPSEAVYSPALDDTTKA